MRRLSVRHLTRYTFTRAVELLTHELRIRPRENHEQTIESSLLTVTPSATTQWTSDGLDNSVACVDFGQPTDYLEFVSEVVVQHFGGVLHLDDWHVHVDYSAADKDLLAGFVRQNQSPAPRNWRTAPLKSFYDVERLNRHIFESFEYARREEPGVQSPDETVGRGAGSCRDLATLHIALCRRAGFAARFVSGYLYAPGVEPWAGSTHAWSEVFHPRRGWLGFDPTIGLTVGSDHIAVAYAADPESVPPVAGSYLGSADASLNVEVTVDELTPTTLDA